MQLCYLIKSRHGCIKQFSCCILVLYTIDITLRPINWTFLHLTDLKFNTELTLKQTILLLLKS